MGVPNSVLGQNRLIDQAPNLAQMTKRNPNRWQRNIYKLNSILKNMEWKDLNKVIERIENKKKQNTWSGRLCSYIFPHW